jgi:hypothetical protein
MLTAATLLATARLLGSGAGLVAFIALILFAHVVRLALTALLIVLAGATLLGRILVAACTAA